MSAATTTTGCCCSSSCCRCSPASKGKTTHGTYHLGRGRRGGISSQGQGQGQGQTQCQGENQIQN